MTKSDLSLVDQRVDTLESHVNTTHADLKASYKKHDQVLADNSTSREKLAVRIGTNTSSIGKANAQLENLSNRIDGVVRTRNKSSADLHTEINRLKDDFAKQNAEIVALRNDQALHAKAINAQLTTAHPPTPAPSIPQSSHAASSDNLADPTNQTNPHHPSNQSILNIVVEGLGEDENEDLPHKLILLCESIGVSLIPTDITNSFRITRRIPIPGRPNPTKFTLRDITVKERIMANKISLRDREDLSGIWINHDESTLVRRARGRARHIASFARKKGSQVQLGHRGITLDYVFYAIDKLDTIPSIYIPPNTLTIPTHFTQAGTTTAINNSRVSNTPELGNTRPTDQISLPPPTWQQSSRVTPTTQNTEPPHMQSTMTTGPSRLVPLQLPARLSADGIDPLQQLAPQPNNQNKSARPKTVPLKKMKETKAGLVYSGPTARFSHLYKVEIIIDSKPYNSVEQKLQYEKAMLARKFKIAADIMAEKETHKIKILGDKIPLTKKWIEMRLPLSARANEAKFNQHKFLMDALLSTGDTRLIEGTTSAFWGGGAHYDSPAYDLGDTHGKNNQGLIIEGVRHNARQMLNTRRQR